MTDDHALPSYNELYRPVLTVLKELGGSGSIEEIDDGVAEALNATPEQLESTYPKSGGRIFTARLAWAKSFLKVGGFLANPSKGVWVLTEAGRMIAGQKPEEIKKQVNIAYKASLAAKKAAEPPDDGPEGPADEGVAKWNDLLLERIQAIDPAAFERLCQRLLREYGFVRVEVTGKPGDGGIDGLGVLRIDLVSFQVLFQCKRYKGSVGADAVRSFRGAMQGRADKGLVITTGVFTPAARDEAARAPAIDLIDGGALCLLLKEKSLGVEVRKRVEEDVYVDESFFTKL